MKPALLALALVAYNNLINLWGGFRGWTYITLNVFVAAALVALALGPAGLSLQQIGLAGNDARAAALAAGAGVVVVLPLFAAAAFGPTARLVADERVTHLAGAEVAFQMLVRIPLGTALLEEVAFRGVLFASWRARGVLFAAVASSVAFGLWHITPTLQLLHANRPDAGFTATIAFVVVGVVATGIGGLLFSWLRVVGLGIAAPLALHATLNSASLLAAVLAHRQT